MAKIKDIAQELGVSSATVSMVLNNRPGVGGETRRRVAEALVQSGYHVASSPRSRRTAAGTIHFIVYKKHGRIIGDTPFFSSLIEEIEGAAKEYGYHLQISYLSEDTLHYIPRDGQGILLLATEMKSTDIKPFLLLQTPIVALDSALPGARVDKVLIDNFDGTFTAVKHLYEKGHRRIGYLRSAVRIKNFDERQEGYEAALRDLGLAQNETFTVTLSSNTEEAYHDMLRYLERAQKLPTAFVADFDVIALGAMKALQEKKVAVPEQVSIIGFDDIPFCTITTPALTTMRVERACLGKVAIDRLVCMIEGDNGYLLKQQVVTSLMERGSVSEKK